MAERNAKNTNKIKKYRKPRNINLGMVIFGFIFVYIIVCVFLSFTEKRIRGYVVAEGALSTNNVYKGIVLRKEEVVTGERTGYVYYYPREGERVAVGDLVYTVDETGQLSDLVESAAMSGNTLDDATLSEMKSDLVEFTHSFSPTAFSQTYDFKTCQFGSDRFRVFSCGGKQRHYKRLLFRYFGNRNVLDGRVRGSDGRYGYKIHV